MGHKGHYGEYTGNAKWSKVTNSNMGATKRDDEAHMKYLKEDIDYDNKHGHSDSSMTSDEKHISKLAGDLKYDEKKHGSPAKHSTAQHLFEEPNMKEKRARHFEIHGKHGDSGASTWEYNKKRFNDKKVSTKKQPIDTPPAKMVSPLNDKYGEALLKGDHNDD